MGSAKNTFVDPLMRRLRSLPALGRDLWRRLAPRLRALPQTLRALWQRLGSRRRVVAQGAAGVTALSLVLMAVPWRTPEQQVAHTALLGKELFDSLFDDAQELRSSSRIDESADRGTGSNLMLLPTGTWDGLSVEQRNSLGTWLNSLGGRWEIRVGELSASKRRIVDAQAVITSRQWNQQTR